MIKCVGQGRRNWAGLSQAGGGAVFGRTVTLSQLGGRLCSPQYNVPLGFLDPATALLGLQVFLY